MSDIDFSQLRQKVTPWGQAILDPITEEVRRRNADAQAEKMQEARLGPQRAREKRLDARDDAQLEHNRATEKLNQQRLEGQQTIAEGDRRSKMEDKIRAAAVDDVDTAEQMGASYQSFDPKTGAVTKGMPGFKIDRGIEPSLPSADGADTTPEEDAAVKEWQRRQSDPDITIGGVTTTRDKLRYSASRAAAGDMQKTEDALNRQINAAQQRGALNEASILQSQLRDLEVRRAQVEGRLVKPNEAIKGNDAATAAAAKQGGAETIQDMRGKSAAEVARINAQGRVDASAGAGDRWEKTNQRNDDKEERQKRVALRGEVSQLSNELGIKDAGKTIRGLQDLQQAVERGGTNSADAARSIGRWVQLAQKDSRISNQDIPVFFGRIGGIEKYGGDPFKMLDAAASGTLQPEIIPQMLEAAKAMLDRERGNVDEFLTAGDEQFSGFYGKHWQDFRRGLMGMGTKKPEGQPSAAPATGGREPSSGLDAPNGPHASDPLEGDDPPAAGTLTRQQKIDLLRKRGMLK